MVSFGAAQRRWSLLALAVFAAAAAVVVPATPGLAQDNDAVGPVVTIDTSGGDVRAAGASVTISGSAANIRAAGASVDVSADAAGSVWAAGGRVVLSGTVGTDLAAAGSAVTFSGRAGGSAQIAGAAVTVDGTINGNLRALGANLTIAEPATIGGRLEAAGGNVTVDGRVDGAVELAGAAVTFNGNANGKVVLSGERIVVGPRAHIAGDLTVYSRHDPEIAASAVIGGTVTRGELPKDINAVPDWAFGLISAAAMVLGTVLAGIVLMLFGGRLFITAVDFARLRPVSTILVGILTLILVPAIAVLLGLTVVGLPITVALLMALPLLFVFGMPVAAAGIAAGIFVRQGPIGIVRAFLFVIVGAIIIALISLIPWIGPAAVAVVTVLGIGGLVRTAGGRLRTPVAAPVVPVERRHPEPRRAPPPPPPPPPPPEEPERPAS